MAQSVLPTSGYSYATGVIRALERNLLGPEILAQMIEAKDLEGALRILRDTGYNLHLEAGIGYSGLTRAEMQRLRLLLARLLPEDPLVSMVFIYSDFLNLKYLTKACIQELEVDLEQLPPSWHEAEQLRDLVFDETHPAEMQELSYYLAGVRRAKALYDQESEPSLIDLCLDQVSYDFLYALLRFRGADFALGYLSAKADLTNILTLLRLAARREEQGYTLPSISKDLIFLPHGSIGIGRLKELLELDRSELSTALVGSKYGSRLGEALEDLGRSGKWTALERAVDEYLVGYLKGAKLIADGYEPVLAYFWAKENECRLLQVILNGKAFGLSPEAIRERLWSTYA